MFYAHIILAKKGPLARVWLAAHWDKKITKAHVFETNIEKSVEGIMQPKVKLALRTSGHLLLGVVRIYSRKAKYLLADCNEAFVKIKMAFRPGMVDLPEGHREANVNAITLPEVFHDFDTALPELNDIDIEAQFSINQSRADEITMREDYGSLSLSLHDDGFGDVGFDNETPDMVRGQMDSNLNNQLFEDEIISNVRERNDASIQLNEPEPSDNRLDGDGFGDEFGQPELFGDELFGEPPRLETENQEIIDAVPNVNEVSDDDVSDHFDARAPSPDFSCLESAELNPKEADVDKEIPTAVNQREEIDENLEQSTLIQNEDESFALAPVDASAYKGVTKTKRKRKLIVDEVKNISGEEMKAQLANTSDIVTTLDLAPPTKRLMYWKETGGVEKLFSLPSRTIPARALFLNYHRHLISHFTQLEDFTCLGPSDILALDHINIDNDPSVIIQNKRGRKRKFDVLPNITETHGDTTTQSLAAPETIREHENIAITDDSLKINNLIPNDSVQTNEPIMFDNCPSPGPLFSMNEIHSIDNLETLGDLALTPGNLSHGIDAVEDFNHGGLTPVNLNHGQITPRHPEIESIESIPNLPVDQISCILNEAENMGNNSKEVSSNVKTSHDLEWNNYDLSPMIEIQNNVDEQMENETSEQFEERVLNKRAAQLFYAVKNRMVKQECLLLSELTVKNSRKQAAQKFYSLLVLKKFRALNISQSSPYADIIVTRGQLFENPKL